MFKLQIPKWAATQSKALLKSQRIWNVTIGGGGGSDLSRRLVILNDFKRKKKKESSYLYYS